MPYGNFWYDEPPKMLKCMFGKDMPDESANSTNWYDVWTTVVSSSDITINVFVDEEGVLHVES